MGGPALAAQFANPQGLAWHAASSSLLVADSVTRRVRKIAVTDDTPAAFQFTAQTGAALSSVVQSNTATPTGFAVATPISVAGGEYSVGCTGTFTAAAGTMTPGQSVCVRHTTSALNNFTTSTALTIGGVKGVFASTTLAGAGSFSASPNPLDFGSRWVYVGSTPVLQLTINNTGATPLQVHSITSTAPFLLSHSCTGCRFPLGASCTRGGLLRATGAGPAQRHGHDPDGGGHADRGAHRHRERELRRALLRVDPGPRGPIRAGRRSGTRRRRGSSRPAAT
jgi:hypothetical protein